MKAERGLRGRHLKVNEEIARRLQDQIRRRELQPGDQLPSERQLAGLFGASRGSVREALRALELSGVIVSRQGGGNFVSDTPSGTSTQPLTQFLERQREHLLDVSEARQMFEPRLAYLAAERATPEDLERLRRAVEDQERGFAAGDVEAVFAADRRFHRLLAESARNQTFIMLHNYLYAIARGDANGASAAMLQHLQNVEANLLDAHRRYRSVLSGQS
jgi:GntR family transcriptional repressor for pyruvate dehydrogenase complex